MTKIFTDNLDIRFRSHKILSRFEVCFHLKHYVIQIYIYSAHFSEIFARKFENLNFELLKGLKNY